MYQHQNTLAQDVKREVMAELRQGGYTNVAQPWGLAGSQGQTYQTVKDSVKNEVLADIQMQQVDKMAQLYGLDRSLSDHKISQMVDARYRTIDNLKSDLKNELLAVQRLDAQRTSDPYIREIANVLLEEARRQQVPLEQLTQSLDRKTAGGTNVMGKVSTIINTGQRKGFLYGVGAMLLLHLLRPSKLQSVVVRSMEEGMAMVDRAKSFVSSHQNPSPAFEPPAPQPEGNPPEGDHHQ